MCRVLMHLFGVIQAHRTSSNLPEPHHYRNSKVCRVLSHEFGVVRPYRTSSNHFAAWGRRPTGQFRVHFSQNTLCAGRQLISMPWCMAESAHHLPDPSFPPSCMRTNGRNQFLYRTKVVVCTRDTRHVAQMIMWCVTYNG